MAEVHKNRLPELPESPYWMVHPLVLFLIMALGTTLWFFTFQSMILNGTID